MSVSPGLFLWLSCGQRVVASSPGILSADPIPHLSYLLRQMLLLPRHHRRCPHVLSRKNR